MEMRQASRRFANSGLNLTNCWFLWGSPHPNPSWWHDVDMYAIKLFEQWKMVAADIPQFKQRTVESLQERKKHRRKETRNPLPRLIHFNLWRHKTGRGEQVQCSTTTDKNSSGSKKTEPTLYWAVQSHFFKLDRASHVGLTAL